MQGTATPTPSGTRTVAGIRSFQPRRWWPSCAVAKRHRAAGPACRRELMNQTASTSASTACAVVQADHASEPGTGHHVGPACRVGDVAKDRPVEPPHGLPQQRGRRALHGTFPHKSPPRRSSSGPTDTAGLRQRRRPRKRRVDVMLPHVARRWAGPADAPGRRAPQTPAPAGRSHANLTGPRPASSPRPGCRQPVSSSHLRLPPRKISEKK